jgi:hypothetical protein
LIKINRILPISPFGKKTDTPKNPFHKLIKIGNDHHPHTGQIAIIIESTLINPTTAPIEINLGLYYSTSLIPDILGMMKLVNNIKDIIIV